MARMLWVSRGRRLKFPACGRLVLCALSALVSTSPFISAAEPVSPLTPEQSLAAFHLEPGLAIELVACEPEVIDPIAIRFDEAGRLWVVEMRDYPNGPAEGQPPLSKIRLLTDENGDGRYETSRIFAEDLLFPTGVQPWQGGIIVTLAGEVIFLKDTDNDGRADLRETWFRGFVAGNPQLRANHPRFGPDNRIYISNGLLGGEIVNPRRPQDPPLSISGRDFCFDPRTGVAEAISGNGQFGLTFDDFGNHFLCSNRQPLDHVVLENRYLARNPFLAVPSVLSPVAPSGEQSKVFPLIRAWTTSNLHAGQFTAACSVEIYRGGLLGLAYHGNAFICEPTGSLVHREVLTPHGATFTSQPAQQGKEFLASTDPWFRPVGLEVGPEGALYVVDIHRAVIEHPDWMPTELRSRPDLRLGDDRGRIYRIVPISAQPQHKRPQLAGASTAELVKSLEHSNSWWRETAARLLYERQSPDATALLTQLAAKAIEPVSRVQSLWALGGQANGLTSAVVTQALADRHPRVREQALVLAERVDRTNPELAKTARALVEDADARVRFQAALYLGGDTGSDVAEPLARIALRDASDPWTRRAVACALPEHANQVVLAILKATPPDELSSDSSEALLVRELSTIVGSRRENDEVALLVNVACQNGTGHSVMNEAALLGLADGLQRRGDGLVEFVAKLPQARALNNLLAETFEHIRLAAIDSKQSEGLRGAKIDLLRHARSAEVRSALAKIAREEDSQQLRGKALAALAPQVDAELAKLLLESYASQSPTIRRAVLDAVIGPSAGASRLLDQVETDTIGRGEIDLARQKRLIEHADPAIAARAKKLLASAAPAERAKVLAEYQPALTLKPDVLAGKQLFRQHCATCHHVADVGVDVAPDISDSRDKTQAQLLTSILSPNQAIDNNYVSYTVATVDGQVHVGLISGETASSITLRQPENKVLTLLRSEIETIRSSGVSLMPEGFEKQLSHQQMADVIGFIKNWRYLEQPVPGTIGSATE